MSVMDRSAEAVQRVMLDTFIAELAISIEPATPLQALIARQEFHEFGQGNHPTALNFADCFSYVLARTYC